MKYKIINEKKEEIITHEMEVLQEFSQIKEKYVKEFNKYQCSIYMKMKWLDRPGYKQIYDNRHQLKYGYYCFIDFIIQKDGKEVNLEDDEGEGYYPLSREYPVSRISWFLRTEIDLINMKEEFEEDLVEFSEMLQIYTTKKANGEPIIYY